MAKSKNPPSKEKLDNRIKDYMKKIYERIYNAGDRKEGFYKDRDEWVSDKLENKNNKK